MNLFKKVNKKYFTNDLGLATFKSSKAKQQKKGNKMNLIIENKCDLINAFIHEYKESKRLLDVVKEMPINSDMPALVLAYKESNNCLTAMIEIINDDKELMESITNGGIVTSGNDLVVIGDDGLCVRKVKPACLFVNELTE